LKEIKTLVKRLELIKDSDPFNKRLMNDCYDTILELQSRLNELETTLENVYESVGTEQKL
jgi:hypothetical protein